VTTYLRAARDDILEFAIDSRPRDRRRTKRLKEFVIQSRQQQLYSRKVGLMTTTGGSPKFLEHADDGTRILNKRRQLFDIKVRCSVSLVLFHSTFFCLL